MSKPEQDRRREARKADAKRGKIEGRLPRQLRRFRRKT
jgi:hypothetical protein